MSLVTNLQNFATATATQDKLLKTLINGNLADLSALTTTNKSNLVAAANELKALINSISAASVVIDDATTSTSKVWSSSKVSAALVAQYASIVGGATSAYDTLIELQNIITADETQIANILTALGNRLRFDASQVLTAPQKTQGLLNLGAVATTDIGDTATDFVAIFNAALV